MRKVGLRVALIVFSAALAQSALCQANTPQDSNKGGKGGGQTRPADAVHDIVGSSFTSASIGVGPKLSAHLDEDLDALVHGTELYWHDVEGSEDKDKDYSNYRTGEALYHVVDRFALEGALTGSTVASSLRQCADTVNVNQSYIFHTTHWMTFGNPDQKSKPTLVSSDWHVYRRPRHPWWEKKTKTNDLVAADTTGAGDPIIYGATQLVVIGIDRFDVPEGQLIEKGKTKEDYRTTGDITSTYSVTITQATPANSLDLGALIGGLAGISSATKALALDGGNPSLYVAVGCRQGTKKLPYAISVSDAVMPPKSIANMQGGASVEKPPQTPNPGTAVCSGAGNTIPCATNRTFTSEDKEYWDVAIGLAIPGVRETKYSFSATTNSVSSSVTKHTDLYALLEFFPLAYYLPKESKIPHIVVGVPVTSQSLYRPLFGLSENLTGWTHLEKRLSLPVALNFFSGLVYMKTPLITGAPPSDQGQFSSQLTTHRVWKPIFGVEVPVSSIASKLGGKSGSKNTNGKSGGTS